MARIDHGCFGGGSPQPPSQMSAGFHQLLPIIVQTGLMFRNEILAVENPEVHLHPSLQLEMTEFLIHQALAGKSVLVETHSDLVIQRVLRAILEEQIPQEHVRVCFADIDRIEGDFRYATLTPLDVDRRGRIANWPQGFMDADVAESRRLLDAAYGLPGDEYEEDEP
jgi:predicted ATPase